MFNISQKHILQLLTVCHYINITIPLNITKLSPLTHFIAASSLHCLTTHKHSMLLLSAD
jgi:hypothetical protein